MLTKELGIAVYKNNRVFPDKLSKSSHKHYLLYAEEMLHVYRNGTGKTRKDLHSAIQRIFQHESDCPPRRINAFCKLLDDASRYRKDIPGKAAKLRKTVFRKAAPFQPLVGSVDRLFEHGEMEIKNKIAAELGRSWEQLEQDLFADIMEYHRLEEFSGIDEAADLLAKYNVAQLQVVLYGAVKMIVWTATDFKTVLRYAKLAKLMHTIERRDDGVYQIQLDGPASTLRKTTRYGVYMAKFLPALISCSDWKMCARIRSGKKNWFTEFNLSHRDNYHSHLPPPADFDSSVEEGFLEKWGTESREGWTLIREGEILWQGQKVFFPDFVLTHEDGRRVLLEIVGFWTPQYLLEKARTLGLFKEYHILLLVDQSIAEKLPELPLKVITYKSAVRLKDVLAYLQENP